MKAIDANVDISVIRLNQLLKENNITMYKLAKDLSVSKQAVIYWSKGINEPKISYIRQLAAYFSVSSDYLLGLEDETVGKTYNNYGTHNGDVKF